MTETVAPASAAEMASVLKDATSGSRVVQIVGGGSHSGYGAPPPPDLLVSTEAMSEIISYEPDDLTLVVEPGASVADIERELGDQGQTAVLPERPGTATIGGVIAAGISSLKRGRLYGTRERILEATVVTGDGRIVRSGGRVVKNVSGYDLTRLHFGAFGSLGVLVSVCLKLWPVPPASATVVVDELARASLVTRPLAVLEENGRVRVYLWGTSQEVDAVARRLGGDAVSGLDWPTDPDGRFRWSLRIPPGMTRAALGQLPGSWSYLALHGVGEIRLGSDDADAAPELRGWAESHGGHLVVVEDRTGQLGDFDPWGMTPTAIDIQRRLVHEFDPARVINPGRLPGGI